jgi:hypothetical protein
LTATRCRVALLLTVGLVGCGGNDGGGVASANGSTSSPTSSATPDELSREERDLKYAQCMRAHGVPMTDPQYQSDQVIFDFEGGANWPNEHKDVFNRAQQACRQYQDGGDGDRMPEEKAEALLQFARCMRERGMENFPDPNANGDIPIDHSIQDDPQFRQAQQTCEAQWTA